MRRKSFRWRAYVEQPDPQEIIAASHDEAVELAQRRHGSSLVRVQSILSAREAEGELQGREIEIRTRGGKR